MRIRSPIGLAYIDLVASTFLVVFILYIVQLGLPATSRAQVSDVYVATLSVSEDTIKAAKKASVAGQMHLIELGMILDINGKKYMSNAEETPEVEWTEGVGIVQATIFVEGEPDVKAVYGAAYDLGLGEIKVDFSVTGLGMSPCRNENLNASNWYTSKCE